MYYKLVVQQLVLLVLAFNIDPTVGQNAERQLFATKTNYNVAKHLLNEHGRPLPDAFTNTRLEEEHVKLVEDSCKPVLFYFFGRHSARFPCSSDIIKYNKHLSELVEKLKTLESLPKKYENLLSWKSMMQPQQGSLITELGANHQVEIAERFKKVYPDFFNADETDIHVGVTKRLRTAQSAAEFLRSVDNFKLQNCDLEQLPIVDRSSPDYTRWKLKRENCYRTLMESKLVENNALPLLEFHKLCEEITGKKNPKDPLVVKIKHSNLFRDMAARISRRLGFPEDNDPIDSDMFDSIIDTCKMETAIREKSVWCELFEDKDIELFEYMRDAESYLRDAYGAGANARQSCPVIKDLMSFLVKQMTIPIRKNAYFFFSHGTSLKKVLARLGMFEDHQSYTEESINEFISQLKIKQNRNWRSSLIMPFSANLAMVLYRCQEPDHWQVKHKLLTLVNEIPVKLPACSNLVCDVGEFFKRHFRDVYCNMKQICSQAQVDWKTTNSFFTQISSTSRKVPQLLRSIFSTEKKTQSFREDAT